MENIIARASEKIDWRCAELIEKFGTDKIKEHRSGLKHGYYDNSTLRILENLETGESYITLELLSAQDSSFYANESMAFLDLDAAKSFIQENIMPGEFLQDFNITDRIWKKILEQHYEN